MQSLFKMRNRKEIVTDYFKLRILLNRGNKRPNEKAEITFTILEMHSKSLRLVALLNNAADEPSIELCFYQPIYGWERSGFSELTALETFCAERLRFFQKNLNLRNNQTLTELNKRNMRDSLIFELRSLGVPQKLT